MSFYEELRSHSRSGETSIQTRPRATMWATAFGSVARQLRDLSQHPVDQLLERIAPGPPIEH